MKKLFATMIILCVLAISLLAYTANALDTTSVTTPIDDSVMTVTSFKYLTWEELVDKSKCIVSAEDKYVSWVIEAINKSKTTGTFPGIEYVSYTLVGIKLDEIKSNRMIEKLERVIETYNHYHRLQLTFTYEMQSEECMNIEVNSINLEWLENPVTNIGEQAYLKDGIYYWETANNFGSGKASNKNIQEDRIVKVEEVAYLSDDGKVIETSNIISEDIRIWDKRMIKISSKNVILGWVYPTHLKAIEECK